MNYIKLSLIFILCISSLFSCQQVRPWERGVLARPEMAWDSDPLGALLQDHIFLVRKLLQEAILQLEVVAAVINPVTST